MTHSRRRVCALTYKQIEQLLREEYIPYVQTMTGHTLTLKAGNRWFTLILGDRRVIRVDASTGMFHLPYGNVPLFKYDAKQVWHTAFGQIRFTTP